MLFPFKLIGSMRISNSHGKGIDTRQLNELHRFIRMGIHTALRIAAPFFTIVVLRADQHAEFSFDDTVMLVSIIYNLAANLDILLERFVTSIDHDACETFI